MALVKLLLVQNLAVLVNRTFARKAKEGSVTQAMLHQRGRGCIVLTSNILAIHHSSLFQQKQILRSDITKRVSVPAMDNFCKKLAQDTHDQVQTKTNLQWCVQCSASRDSYHLPKLLDRSLGKQVTSHIRPKIFLH